MKKKNSTGSNCLCDLSQNAFIKLLYGITGMSPKWDAKDYNKTRHTYANIDCSGKQSAVQSDWTWRIWHRKKCVMKHPEREAHRKKRVCDKKDVLLRNGSFFCPQHPSIDHDWSTTAPSTKHFDFSYSNVISVCL